MIHIISATIRGQSLRVSYSLIVSDTINYLTATFSFKTDDWSGLEKWAHFRKDDTVIDIKLTNDKILSSDSLNLSSGEWKLKIHGNVYENGKVKRRITTESATICVKEFGDLEGEPFPDAPPTEIEKIYAQIEELKKNGGGGAGSGENGATFTPSVSDDGVISWTNDKGLPNPEPKNIKGGKGDPFKYGDFTPEQLEALKGKPFTYEDFTPEQLEALKGKNGKSAYEIAVDDGFEGTEAEWLASLKGDPYELTEADKQTIADAVLDEVSTVETAEVGQTIVVKAVDENGKPTEWEAADFPSGGENAEWVEVVTHTIEAETSVWTYGFEESDEILVIANGLLCNNITTVDMSINNQGLSLVACVATGAGLHTTSGLELTVHVTAVDDGLFKFEHGARGGSANHWWKGGTNYQYTSEKTRKINRFSIAATSYGANKLTAGTITIKRKAR